MFNFGKDKEKRMAFIQNFTPTCKMQLLQVCLWYCDGDTEKAQDMFNYYAGNVDLPDTEPIPPTWQQNTKETVNGLIAWFKENQDVLSQGIEFVRTVVAKKGALPAPESPTPIPPINQ